MVSAKGTKGHFQLGLSGLGCLPVLFDVHRNADPLLPVRNPNVFRGRNTCQIVERTKGDGNVIWSALAFRKNLAAATGTKFPGQVIARGKFAEPSRDGHHAFGKKGADKKGGTCQALTIPAMTGANVDGIAMGHILHRSTKTTSGSHHRRGFFVRRFGYHCPYANGDALLVQVARFLDAGFRG